MASLVSTALTANGRKHRHRHAVSGDCDRLAVRHLIEQPGLGLGLLGCDHAGTREVEDRSSGGFIQDRRDIQTEMMCKRVADGSPYLGI